MSSRRDFLRSVAIGGPFTLIYDTRYCSAMSPPPKVQPLDAKRALSKLIPLHEAKKPPQPGDWLKSFPDEKGQSFAQYLKRRERVGKTYPRLYLQPIGDIEETLNETMTSVAEGLSTFFGLPTLELKPIPLGELNSSNMRKRGSDARQIMTGYLLEQLKTKRPRDAAAVLGLTTEDVYPGDKWNYVFGQASLQERVGVWSTHRLGNPNGTDEEQKLFRRRMLKLAWHETGHMFGIVHCIAYECLMNGSNHLEESDRKPVEYCPECQAKIWWTNDFDPKTRAQGLLELAEKEGWTKDIDYWKSAIEKMKT